MRIQEVPRTPDETFYFDRDGGHTELVVSQDALGEGLWPNVEVYSDQSVVMTIERSAGGEVGHGSLGTKVHRLYPGQRIVNIKTGSEEERQIEVPETGEWLCVPGGQETGSYVPGDDDELIVERDFTDGSQEERIMAFSVRTFLPGMTGTSYEALGIMRPNGALVAWGDGARHAARLVDLAHANALARNEGDWHRLKDELTRNEHLVGIMLASKQVSAYFGHFLQKYGVDFMPTRDPRERSA